MMILTKREAFKRNLYSFNPNYLPTVGARTPWGVDGWIRYIDAFGGWRKPITTFTTTPTTEGEK